MLQNGSHTQCSYFYEKIKFKVFLRIKTAIAERANTANILRFQSFTAQLWRE